MKRNSLRTLRTRTIRTVKGVVDWRLCVGCGACAPMCPETKIHLVDVLNEGIRPVVANENCAQCTLCLDVCPAFENDHRPLLHREGIDAALAPLLGPVLQLWEGHACDPEIRHLGASGGALTALALFCLERENMYGVLHTGGNPTDPVRNLTRLSRTRAELLACSGSRYSPSSVCDGFGLLEFAPAPCVFIGQPSEVTALRKAQALKPSLDQKVGIALSFFCAGSPATLGTLELLRSHGFDPGEVEELRYRGLGWPGMFAVRRKGDSQFTPLLTYKDSWGFLQKHRPFSLHLLPDGCGEDADVVCGDPWYRPPTNGEPGRSLVIARTELGRRLILAAEAAGYLELQPAKPEHALKSQENLLRKRSAIWGRILAMRMLGLPAPRLRGFSLFRTWLRLGWKEQAKSVLGTLRRILQRGFLRPNDLAKATVHPLDNVAHLQRNPPRGLHSNLTTILPPPFGRGEGRGEGSRSERSASIPVVLSDRGEGGVVGVSARSVQVCLMGASLELGNRGVAALAASLAKLVSASDPKTKITFLLGRDNAKPFTLRTPSGLQSFPVVNYRLTPKARLREQLWWIVLLAGLYRLLPFRWFRKRVAHSSPWFRAVTAADWVGDIRGGDSFSDIYGMKRFVCASLAVISVIWIKGSIVLLPQTYGPFSSALSRGLARYIFRRASLILARDQASLEVARSFAPRATRTRLCPDVAFALESMPTQRVEAQPALTDDPTGILIGLNVSGLLWNGGYTRKNMFGLKLDYREFLVSLVQGLLADPRHRLLLVPHTFAPPTSVESDPAACLALRDLLPDAVRDRAHFLLGEYDQSEIKGVIGRCHFFLGSRMHSCIAALSQYIPTVGIAYSRKFLGVFDSIGVGDWVIEGRNLSASEAAERCLQLFGQRAAMREELVAAIPNAQQKLRQIFTELLGGPAPVPAASPLVGLSGATCDTPDISDQSDASDESENRSRILSGGLQPK